MKDRDLLVRIQENPSGFGLNGTYHSTAMFIEGYDLARDGGVLRGFNEWLSVRAGELSSQHWIRRLLSEAIPDFRFQGFENLRLTPDEDRLCLAHLLSSVIEFLAVRDGWRTFSKMYAEFHTLVEAVYQSEMENE